MVGGGRIGSVGDDELGYGDGRLGYGDSRLGYGGPEVSAWIESSGTAAWRIGNRGGKSRGKGSTVNGEWKESSGADIRGIRTRSGNERKGGKAVRVACIIFDKDNPQEKDRGLAIASASFECP